MAKKMYENTKWSGLADYLKEGQPDNFTNGQAVDYRTDPKHLTLLPDALKESGSVVTDFIKWFDTAPNDLSVFSYGDTGNLYKRTTAGSWSFLHQAPGSHGNGLAYFYGDDYLYYLTDTTIGRYGPISGGSPQFSDDFLKAQGGIPMNTASLVTASASSMYATAASSASLQITSDLTLETYFKCNSLPTAGNSMTLVAKWDESVAKSYKMDLFGISGYFGNSSNGNLVISVDTTQAPIDSACTGTSGAYALSATNASFAVGQEILIIQMYGANAGVRQRNTIQGYTAGTITLGKALNISYVTGAQVIVLNQYGNVTVNNGITWTSKAWNGTVGGILTFLASGTVTNNGTITASGKGFRGGAYATSNYTVGYQGEGSGGLGSVSSAANGNGGGSGDTDAKAPGGGGNATDGYYGGYSSLVVGGQVGTAFNSNDLSTMTFGGGGGGGSRNADATPGIGGNGGGIVYIIGANGDLSNGTISVNGSNGGDGSTGFSASGGAAGAGGCIKIDCQTMPLGTNKMSATGGTGGLFHSTYGGSGGNGSVGRIAIAYYTSYTGTTTPTINATQDNTLVTTTSVQARIGISNDGTAFEYLTSVIVGLTTGSWNRLSIAWKASTSTAQFYLNGNNFGQSTGTKVAINSNASALSVAANKTTVYANFFDGKLNDMRIWNSTLNASQIYANNQVQLTGSEGGLKAYYTYNSVYTDKTANANTLTPINSPTFDTNDVPYPAATTRLDIDQSYTTIGQTYTLKTAISEAVTDQLVFTPLLDPQKSVDLNISAKGTGNWTITVHDQQNKVVATVTVANATLSSSGYYEFIFASPWRIVIGKTYHIHVTSTVADGIVVTSTTGDLRTADFHTYIGFLVNDVQFHPVARFLNKILIGNERYIGTWDGAFYNPNFIALPPQTHIRCFGFWREYIAIGTWSETSAGSGNIYDWPVGKIYFWDGISLTFNFFIDIADGQVNSLQGIDTTLYISAGWTGQLSAYQGGYVYASNNTMTSKVKKIPNIERQSYLEVYPQAMCMWRSLLHIGIAANSNSVTLPKGIYSWGTLNPLQPESLSNDYQISTGNIGNTVFIGAVYPAGQTLLMSWKDGNSYGVDQVNFLNNPPAAVGFVEDLIQDYGAMWNQKLLIKEKASFLPLKTGESVSVKYKLDRATNWTTLTTQSTVGAIEADGDISGRCREFQLRFDLMASGSTSPTVLAVAAVVDDGESEKQF